MPTGRLIELHFEPTGKRDRWGFRQYRLSLRNNGKAVDAVTAISGSPRSQQEPFVHPIKDYSGSGRVIPEGVYLIDDPLHDSGMFGGQTGIGTIWIGLRIKPGYEANNRGGFGIHADANRNIPGYRGSLGCICPYSDLDIERVVRWMKSEARPQQLVVNLRTGFLKQRGYSFSY